MRKLEPVLRSHPISDSKNAPLVGTLNPLATKTASEFLRTLNRSGFFSAGVDVDNPQHRAIVQYARNCFDNIAHDLRQEQKITSACSEILRKICSDQYSTNLSIIIGNLDWINFISKIYPIEFHIVSNNSIIKSIFFAQVKGLATLKSKSFYCALQSLMFSVQIFHAQLYSVRGAELNSPERWKKLFQAKRYPTPEEYYGINGSEESDAFYTLTGEYLKRFDELTKQPVDLPPVSVPSLSVIVNSMHRQVESPRKNNPVSRVRISPNLAKSSSQRTAIASPPAFAHRHHEPDAAPYLSQERIKWINAMREKHAKNVQMQQTMPTVRPRHHAKPQAILPNLQPSLPAKSTLANNTHNVFNSISESLGTREYKSTLEIKNLPPDQLLPKSSITRDDHMIMRKSEWPIKPDISPFGMALGLHYQLRKEKIELNELNLKARIKGYLQENKLSENLTDKIEKQFLKLQELLQNSNAAAEDIKQQSLSPTNTA